MPHGIALPAARDDIPAPVADPADEDVLCPMCDYNLRGLSEPRCPECGYQFFWIDLLDPRRKLHPYLFEHHPRRNIWSFYRTLIGGLRPRRFWTSLLPSQPSRLGRLWVYCIVTSLIALAGPVGQLLRETVNNYLGGEPLWDALSVTLEASGSIVPLFVIATVFLAWTGLTYWTMMIFGTSMELAKVNSSHVKRCVIYGQDVCVFYGVFVFLAGIFAPRQTIWAPQVVVQWAVWALFASVIIFAYRLCQAYHRYMRFHRPVAMVIATQIIVGLIMFNLFLAAAVNGWLP